MRMLRDERKIYEEFIKFIVPTEKIWIKPTKPPKDFENHTPCKESKNW